MNEKGMPIRPARATELFPGRLTLRVTEVARVLSRSPQEIVELLRSGILAGEDVARPGEPVRLGTITPFANWRIPIAGFDAFVKDIGKEDSRPVQAA